MGKLVRDQILAIIEENGEQPIFRILDEEGFNLLVPSTQHGTVGNI